MEIALSSLYCDVQFLNDTEVSDALPVASLMSIDNLFEKAERYIVDNFNVQNCCMFIKLASKVCGFCFSQKSYFKIG